MRRLPSRSIQLLSRDMTGIIHFAGTTHGDALMLCKHPLQYPTFLTAVIPLYLMTIKSFQDTCPASIWNFNDCNITYAIDLVRSEVARLNVTISYNGGLGKFRWT